MVGTMENISLVDLISFLFSLIAVGFVMFTYRSNVVHDRKKATLEMHNVLQGQALDMTHS